MTLGSLVLLRHGQSTYNAENRFTGMLDVPLSARGADEAATAGAHLAEAVRRDPALTPARVVTSPLVRASATASIVAATLPGPPPLDVDWRLVERHYGAFTAELRETVRTEHGEAAYWEYRRSLDHRPPPLEPGTRAHTLVDDVLLRLPDAARAALRRGTESLADVVARLAPFWAELQGDLAAGRSVLVVGHGNSLRALSLLVDRLTPEEVQDLNIPTGHPLVHHVEQTPDGGLRPVPRGGTYLDARGAEVALEVLDARGGT
ncbi:2,3-bisphosphoglycerate-dependent phosphoglycerate mutase [Oerskovia flava]|uniref:2,3-bisphosphoglycerate-dependent phosphoglycerate mutase n=1 Tax=Oerskovia flava TaxID=2986422 RepID=UPI00223F4CEE|nr:2,3-bisphosphoglycerate-dependent phosphoglycerate mutase [Oerskovia sp. JB1-3-2]